MDKIRGFDKQRLVNNISFFIEEQNKRIGEIEEAVGVSQGYLSKLSKPSSRQMPSLETVCRLADLFGVSVDDLLYTSFPILTKRDREVHDFLETIVRQTATEEISWEPVDYNEAVYNSKNGKDVTAASKIFDLEHGQEIFIEDFADGRQYLKQPLKVGIFSGDKTYLDGYCYRKDLSEFDAIYVLKAIHISEETDEPETLYLVILDHDPSSNRYGGYDDPNDVSCTQLMIREPRSIDKQPASVQSLYETIRDHEGNYRLTPLATNVIKAYLTQVHKEATQEKDNPNEEQPLDSENLPF